MLVATRMWPHSEYYSYSSLMISFYIFPFVNFANLKNCVQLINLSNLLVINPHHISLYIISSLLIYGYSAVES